MRVQDPVARTVSSHNMLYNAKVNCYGSSCRRPTLPLLQEFRKHRDLDFDWPEDLSGCNFNEKLRNPEFPEYYKNANRCMTTAVHFLRTSESNWGQLTAYGGYR